jgi:hypothetical protein
MHSLLPFGSCRLHPLRISFSHQEAVQCTPPRTTNSVVVPLCPNIDGLVTMFFDVIVGHLAHGTHESNTTTLERPTELDS